MFGEGTKIINLATVSRTKPVRLIPGDMLKPCSENALLSTNDFHKLPKRMIISECVRRSDKSTNNCSAEESSGKVAEVHKVHDPEQHSVNNQVMFEALRPPWNPVRRNRPSQHFEPFTRPMDRNCESLFEVMQPYNGTPLKSSKDRKINPRHSVRRILQSSGLMSENSDEDACSKSPSSSPLSIVSSIDTSDHGGMLEDPLAPADTRTVRSDTAKGFAVSSEDFLTGISKKAVAPLNQGISYAVPQPMWNSHTEDEDERESSFAEDMERNIASQQYTSTIKRSVPIGNVMFEERLHWKFTCTNSQFSRDRALPEDQTVPDTLNFDSESTLRNSGTVCSQPSVRRLRGRGKERRKMKRRVCLTTSGYEPSDDSNSSD